MKILLKTVICLVLFTTVVFAQTDPETGRALKVSPEIASDKPNVPVKKETFVAKLDRYASEGFKAAVVISVPDSLFSRGADPNSMGSSATTGTVVLYGGIPIDTDFTPIAENFAKAMNEEFNTEVFEVVDDMNIPLKEGQWRGLDWSSTKYRMVITYSISLVYSYTNYMDKYKGVLEVTQRITGTEYVNEKGKVKMKYPIKGGNMGAYNSPAWESESNPNISRTLEIHKLVDPPMGAELVAELVKEQNSSMPKFIEKQRK